MLSRAFPGAPPEMLWELLDFLKSTSNPVFTDHVIHMLMIALTIFSGDDPDRNVRDVHAVAESMLRTHLSSEEEVMLVLRSVSLLPRIAQLKQKMLTEVKNFARRQLDKTDSEPSLQD